MWPEREDTARQRRPSQPELSPGPRDEGVVTVLRGPAAGALFTLDGPRTLIGRGSEAQIYLRDGALSRRHAIIVHTANGFVVEDLGSTNGTHVDGERIQGAHPLADGSRIEIGKEIVLRFALHDKAERDAARRTHELTVRDSLTQLHNRVHLDERLDAEVAFSRRHGAPLSVLMIDVDNFKQINDGHGHETGDCALRVISKVLRRTVRVEDELARYGGEEFAVLARGIDIKGAKVLAERIREGVEVLAIPTPRGQIRMSVSIGIAHSPGGLDVSPQSMVAGADGALYAAKAAGRNRIEVASDLPVARQSGTRHRKV